MIWWRSSRGRVRSVGRNDGGGGGVGGVGGKGGRWLWVDWREVGFGVWFGSEGCMVRTGSVVLGFDTGPERLQG
jgi:hypothetical protein